MVELAPLPSLTPLKRAASQASLSSSHFVLLTKLSTGVEVLQELSNAAAADVPSYRGRFDAFRLIYSKLTLLFVVEMIVRMSSICEMKFWRAGIPW